jgi:hypothetical protein
MQLFTDYTQENLNNESDPLFLLCYPVSKLQFISDVLESFEDSGSTPFLNFHKRRYGTDSCEIRSSKALVLPLVK